MREELDIPLLDEVIPGSIINSGLVQPGYGFDLLLQALPDVVRQQPKALVTVTTYQRFPPELTRRIEAMGLNGHVQVRGYIPDRKEFGRIVRRHRVGLALYEPRIETHKKYSDSRIKTYLARGVPVIMTRVSPLAREVEKEGAGLVIDYDNEQLVAALLRILCDDVVYVRYRESAIHLAQQYLADEIFCGAFHQMGVES